jgi:hypothetical protein
VCVHGFVCVGVSSLCVFVRQLLEGTLTLLTAVNVSHIAADSVVAPGVMPDSGDMLLFVGGDIGCCNMVKVLLSLDDGTVGPPSCFVWTGRRCCNARPCVCACVHCVRCVCALCVCACVCVVRVICACRNVRNAVSLCCPLEH